MLTPLNFERGSVLCGPLPTRSIVGVVAPTWPKSIALGDPGQPLTRPTSSPGYRRESGRPAPGGRTEITAVLGDAFGDQTLRFLDGVPSLGIAATR